MIAPTFSICIPNYNYARYLTAAIDSVLTQSFEDFEIVVVDNNSTDGSVEAVRAIGDPRIRLFCNQYNVGFAANVQRATQHARGRFMLVLSSDDLMRPGALARYHDVLVCQKDRADSTIICSATDEIDQHGEVKKVLYKPAGRLLPTAMSIEAASGREWVGVEHLRGHDVLREALRRCSSVATFCATMYPRRMWEAVEGYDTAVHIAPDAAFLHKLLASDPDCVWVNERLFAYRVHDANQTALVSSQAALKVQVDIYMRTVQYSQAVLDRVGVTRDEVIRGFLNETCFTLSAAQLSRGHWLQAFKIFAFALAAYPGHAVRLPRFYAAGGLLALGPLGVQLSRTIKNAVRASNKES